MLKGNFLRAGLPESRGKDAEVSRPDVKKGEYWESAEAISILEVSTHNSGEGGDGDGQSWAVS